MKIKLKIKHRWSGSLLFEYEKENNTIYQTLMEAIKSNTDLRGANLRGADLSNTDLSNTDLSSANLSNTDLLGANLSNTDLSSADLRSANLSNTDLLGANLRSANLLGANLSGANLRSAKLLGANLSCANLSSAVNAEYAIATTRICPEGDIIGYKKCRKGVIVKLSIPKEAKRNNAFGRKCRAEYADVLEIFGAETAVSEHDKDFTYKVGQRVQPTVLFSDDFTEECSSGIHFFITRVEAENYN